MMMTVMMKLIKSDGERKPDDLDFPKATGS